MTLGAVEVRDQRMDDVLDGAAIEEVAGGFRFTEGPVWDPRSRRLIFSDIGGDTMYSLSASGDVSVYRRPSNKANGNVYDRDMRLITCEHATSRVIREETDGSVTMLAAKYAGQELNSPNDVVVAGDGEIYFTDPTFGRQDFFGLPRAESQDCRAVYALQPDRGSLWRVCTGFDQPNGLCLSADERWLYVNDTPRMHIKRFPLNHGRAGPGKIWAELTGEGDGSPDGMKFDSSGRLFCTGPGGVHVFAPDATCLGVIRTPTSIANFNWGGDDLRDLYLCGGQSLYRVRVKVPGPGAS